MLSVVPHKISGAPHITDRANIVRQTFFSGGQNRLMLVHHRFFDVEHIR